MSVKISVKGVGLVKTKLGKLPSRYNRAAQLGMNKAVAIVEASAKRYCPVDTGNLRASIAGKTESYGSDIVGTVGTSVEYAPYVEFGTGRRGGYPYETNIPLSYGDIPGQAAQPFLGRALHNNKRNISKILHESMKVQF